MNQPHAVTTTGHINLLNRLNADSANLVPFKMVPGGSKKPICAALHFDSESERLRSFPRAALAGLLPFYLKSFHISDIITIIKITAYNYRYLKIIADNIFHLSVHYVCYPMLVQRFEPQGRCFTNFHYYHHNY